MSWPTGRRLAGPAIFATGTATYRKTFGGGQNRWGDYSAAMSDPGNDHDFWTAQTHSEPWVNGWPEQGRWVTRIAHVTPPAAVAAPAGAGGMAVPVA